jgi:uncharacterized protein involved in exopolysaccharide biosynthesis
MSNEASDYVDFRDEDESAGLPAQLRDPIGVLRRQYRWILATAVLMSILVASATAFFPLIYYAYSRVLVTAMRISVGF